MRNDGSFDLRLSTERRFNEVVKFDGEAASIQGSGAALVGSTKCQTRSVSVSRSKRTAPAKLCQDASNGASTAHVKVLVSKPRGEVLSVVMGTEWAVRGSSIADNNDTTDPHGSYFCECQIYFIL